MNLFDLVAHLDTLLKTAELPDYGGAQNGLQVENSGAIDRVAVAVDASEETIRKAVDAGCNLLIAHHGLYWDGVPVATGRRYRRLRLLIENDVAVYSSHLPLDVHPQLGNNVLLAEALGIEPVGQFGLYSGMPIGVWGNLLIRREALAARLDDLLGVRVKLIAGGPEMISRVGVMTGGAGGRIYDAVAARLDAFVTGEGAHHTYFDAMEDGINVYYAGHYATETFGVRALGQHLEERFGLPFEFIDCPTGL
jgi:dinuclear metal center YbgI/SA1388 family protein